MPKNESLKKILVLGSGAIKIGEAGEFDYSGSQCLKAIHEDGINSVLINPNIATIQTDTRFADKVYLLPVNAEYVESIIEKERPDGIMLAYGGQTALNCGVNLDDSGILQKYGVSVLGTQIPGIKRTEDRQLFKDSMKECGMPVLKSSTVTNFEDAKKAAEELSYPVIIRVAYTLGGRGGGVAYNEIELHEIVERGLKASLVGQVLVEEYIGHWKQIEYEVMQDYDGNNVIVCNMENVLSMKVHTGDNIVVAPSQTIDNHEYHMLRTAALRATKHVGIVGECNIQYALDSDSDRYVAIEINPRLSRSSALASKATGYPLAYMSAKIGLGYNLSELVNRITKSTTACFEPSLDYIVCKHPRWDFEKFELVNRRLGPTMKSVGEVMAVGRTFEESFQKAIRMLDIGNDGLVLNRSNGKKYTDEEIEYKLSHHDDHVLYHVAIALKMGISVNRIYELSTVDPWFIEKIQNIVDTEEKLKNSELDASLLWESKKMGFADKQIARAKDKTPDEIRDLRKNLGVIPSVKQIDTLAAEWPAVTNYLYLTYGGHSNDVVIPEDQKGIVVLGAGPYRIGSSVEFDWGTVNMVWGLQENGEKNVSVVNCNPETVSTDYDICTRLYFEELTQERILDIADFENPKGIITCVGGQTANNLTPGLAQHGVNILGTSKRKGGKGSSTGKKGTGGGRFKKRSKAKAKRGRKDPPSKKRKNRSKGTGGKQAKSKRRTMGGSKKASRSRPQRAGKNRVSTRPKTSQTAFMMASGYSVPTKAKRAKAAQGATRRKVKRRDIQTCKFENRNTAINNAQGTKRINSRAKLAYAKRRRLRSNTNVLKVAMPSNLSLGITAARFLRPISSVSILTTRKPEPKPDPPPDIPASSTNDELVLQSPDSLSNVLREMSIATYRPEILGMLDFLPTVDNTGQPTDVHTLMKLRETVHELKVENVEDTLEALEDGDIEGSYTSLKDSYIASTQETSQLLDTLSSVIRSTGLAKLSLDIKDNDSVLSAIAHQALTSQEVGTDGIDQSDLSFKNIMINELDFSSEGYASFCNTKVLGQLFTDLRRAIVRHSYSLMSNDNPARGDDENSVKYNFDYLAPHHRFKFRIWKVGKNFDATNYDDYLEFLGSLPTSTSDKVRLLIVSISRELVVSSGMGFLAKKTLGERFNVMESPLRSSIGHVGKNVLSPTKPAGSLSDYLVIDDTTGNQILPFETRSFRDTKNRVFLPGGSVFIDTALEGEGSKMFNVDSFDVFAKEFNKVTDDVEELIADLLNLEDENKELHASNIYKDMLQGFLDSVEGTKNARQLNQEQAAVIALLKLCNTNPQLKHLVFKFVLEIRDILVSVTKQESEQLAKKSALVAEKETIAAQKINLQMMADQYLTAGGSHPSSPAYVAYHSLLSQIRGLDSQTAQIDAQISSPDINIASASPSTTSLTSGTSFSTMTNMIMRTPSTTVSSLRSKIGKGTSSKQLMLKASPNPLTTTAQSIISIVAETMQEVSISSLKGYSSYRYNLQSLYSTLRSMSSTTRRSKNLLLCMAETAMTLQKSAGALATRDGGEERYTSNGLTNWHSWSGDSLLLLIFESYCSLASDYCSSSIVRLSRDRVQLVIDTSVNEGLDEALGDILELSKEDSTSFKDEMAQDRSSGVKSQTTKSNELLAQKGALSLGAAIRSYDDSKDTDALFADLSSNLEAFENDLDFIRKSLAVIQAIGTNLETSAAQMKSFFDMNDSSSDIKKTLISLSTTPKGRRILSTITPQQLALYRYLSNQLSAPSSTSSYLPERFMKSEQASNAVDVVLRDAAFGGVQANNIRVLAAGIPNGMISALMNPPYVMGSKESSETGAQENLVKINVYKRDLEFGDIIFKPRSFIFDTSLFIMSNAFSDINTTRDNFSTVAATKTRYTQVLPDGIQNSVTGQDLIEEERYGSIGGTTAATMLSNHLVDWAMKEYYRTNFGVDIHEANFTGDETTNELLIDPDGLSALMLAETDESTLTWITTGDVPIADLTGHVSLENSNYVQVADINDAKQFLVPSVSNVISSGEELEEELELPELSAEQLDNFRMLCKSTLFGPGVMKRNIMSPRMFDRVFMLPIDPDDFAIDIEATLETELGKEKYTSKTLKTITTVVQNAEGIDEVRLLPKNMGENYSAFNEFFVTVETVSTGE